MVTTSKADKPKAKQKPVKKKPEKGESKQPDKGTKSPAVLDENAARDLRSEASDNDNEDSELPNILIMLLLALAEFLRGPLPLLRTNIQHCSAVRAIRAVQTTEEAHECYIMMLKENGKFKAKGRGCPYIGYSHIPNHDIFRQILETILAIDIKTVGVAPVPRAVRRVYGVWKTAHSKGDRCF